jgi:hypothetical protein
MTPFTKLERRPYPQSIYRKIGIHYDVNASPAPNLSTAMPPCPTSKKEHKFLKADPKAPMDKAQTQTEEVFG